MCEICENGMDLNGFLSFITIDQIKNDGEFGHFPFMGVFIDANNKTAIIGMADVQTVESVYKVIIAGTIKFKAKKFFFAIDYPGNDMVGEKGDDFIGIFEGVEKDGQLDRIITHVLPYSPETGERRKIESKGTINDSIYREFMMVAKHVVANGITDALSKSMNVTKDDINKAIQKIKDNIKRNKPS